MQIPEVEHIKEFGFHSFGKCFKQIVKKMIKSPTLIITFGGVGVEVDCTIP